MGAERPAAPAPGAGAHTLRPRLALVVAVADNGVIGRQGGLPWHLPDDLRHFKAVTLGKPILMGRRTFQSIGRPLPGRRNLVLSRTASDAGLRDEANAVEYVRSLEEACERTADCEELCVIGGAQLYRLALARATRIYLTRVHAAVQGDAYFDLAGQPARAQGRDEVSDGWREVSRREHPADARHAYAMSFVQLER